MRIEILDQAEDDLIEGFHFYEAQRPDLGSYFLVTLYEVSVTMVYPPPRWLIHLRPLVLDL